MFAANLSMRSSYLSGFVVVTFFYFTFTFTLTFFKQEANQDNFFVCLHTRLMEATVILVTGSSTTPDHLGPTWLGLWDLVQGNHQLLGRLLDVPWTTIIILHSTFVYHDDSTSKEADYQEYNICFWLFIVTPLSPHPSGLWFIKTDEFLPTTETTVHPLEFCLVHVEWSTECASLCLVVSVSGDGIF